MTNYNPTGIIDDEYEQARRARTDAALSSTNVVASHAQSSIDRYNAEMSQFDQASISEQGARIQADQAAKQPASGTIGEPGPYNNAPTVAQMDAQIKAGERINTAKGYDTTYTNYPNMVPEALAKEVAKQQAPLIVQKQAAQAASIEAVAEKQQAEIFASRPAPVVSADRMEELRMKKHWASVLATKRKFEPDTQITFNQFGAPVFKRLQASTKKERALKQIAEIAAAKRGELPSSQSEQAEVKAPVLKLFDGKGVVAPVTQKAKDKLSLFSREIETQIELFDPRTAKDLEEVISKTEGFDKSYAGDAAIIAEDIVRKRTPELFNEIMMRQTGNTMTDAMQAGYARENLSGYENLTNKEAAAKLRASESDFARFKTEAEQGYAVPKITDKGEFVFGAAQFMPEDLAPVDYSGVSPEILNMVSDPSTRETYKQQFDDIAAVKASILLGKGTNKEKASKLTIANRRQALLEERALAQSKIFESAIETTDASKALATIKQMRQSGIKSGGPYEKAILSRFGEDSEEVGALLQAQNEPVDREKAIKSSGIETMATMKEGMRIESLPNGVTRKSVAKGAVALMVASAISGKQITKSDAISAELKRVGKGVVFGSTFIAELFVSDVAKQMEASSDEMLKGVISRTNERLRKNLAADIEKMTIIPEARAKLMEASAPAIYRKASASMNTASPSHAEFIFKHDINTDGRVMGNNELATIMFVEQFGQDKLPIARMLARSEYETLGDTPQTRALINMFDTMGKMMQAQQSNLAAENKTKRDKFLETKGTLGGRMLAFLNKFQTGVPDDKNDVRFADPNLPQLNFVGQTLYATPDLAALSQGMRPASKEMLDRLIGTDGEGWHGGGLPLNTLRAVQNIVSGNSAAAGTWPAPEVFDSVGVAIGETKKELAELTDVNLPEAADELIYPDFLKETIVNNPELNALWLEGARTSGELGPRLMQATARLAIDMKYAGDNSTKNNAFYNYKSDKQIAPFLDAANVEDRLNAMDEGEFIEFRDSVAEARAGVEPWMSAKTLKNQQFHYGGAIVTDQDVIDARKLDSLWSAIDRHSMHGTMMEQVPYLMPSEQKNVKKNIVEFLVAPDSAIDPFGIIEKALKPLEGKNFLRNYMRRKLEESPIVDAIAGMTAKSGLIAGAKVTDWRESAKELLDDVMLSIYKEYERTYGK